MRRAVAQNAENARSREWEWDQDRRRSSSEPWRSGCENCRMLSRSDRKTQSDGQAQLKSCGDAGQSRKKPTVVLRRRCAVVTVGTVTSSERGKMLEGTPSPHPAATPSRAKATASAQTIPSFETSQPGKQRINGKGRRGWTGNPTLAHRAR